MFVRADKVKPLMVEQSDEEIVTLVRNGFPEAFSVVYQRYQQRVFRLAFGMTGDHEHAADLTQEIFFKVHKCLPSFKEDSSFSTWLYRIALNHCLNHCRKQRRANELIGTSDYENQYALSQRNKPAESETKLLAQEIQWALKRALLRLKPFERAIIILRDIEGLSYEDIAAQLNCSQGTVASRLSRARTKLELRLRHLKGKI